MKELTKVEKTQGALTTQQTAERAKLTTQLHATRNAYNDLQGTILKQNDALRKNSGFVNGVRKGVQQWATSLVGVSVAIIAVQRVLSSATKTIIDFQQNNARLASVLGKTRSEITALTEDAKRLGSTTAFTAVQVSQLQTEFAKLGFSESEILSAAEATLSLAAATQTDLAEAASVAGSTVRGFGLRASETQRVVDVMAKSFSSSALDMSKFSTAMAQVAPVAKNAGLSLEQTTAALGILVDRGVDASTAGTGLRGILLDLAGSGKTLEEAFNEINSSTNKNAKAFDLFGKRGATVATILAENSDQADILTDKLENAGGAAEKMATEQLDTLSGSLTKLSSAWEGFILSLEDGEGAFSQIVRGFVDTATAMLAWISQVDEATAAQQLLDKTLSGSRTDALDRIKTTKLEIAQNEFWLKTYEDRIAILIRQNSAGEITEKQLKDRMTAIGIENETRQRQLEVGKQYLNLVIENEEAILALTDAEIKQTKAVEDTTDAVGKLKDKIKDPLKLEFYIETEDVSIADAFTDEFENLSRDVGFIADDLMDEFKEPIDEGIYDIIAANEEAAKEIEEQWKSAYKTIGLAATDAFGSVIAAQYEQQVARAKQTAEIETQVLKDKLDKGIINETEYTREVEELQREVREKEKQASIAQAVIDGASAVLKGIAQFGPPPSIPGIAAIAAAALTTGAQIAVIESQTFADGGVFDGASHEKGGIKGTLNGKRIEVEGDEMWIANKRAKRSNKIHTAKGTPEEIISGLNGIYGGRNWKQGAKISDAMQVDYTQGGSTIQQIIQAELSDARIVRELSRQRKENNRNSRDLKETLKLKAHGYY
jgi:DNA-binding FrmR family transcriptional regulator